MKLRKGDVVVFEDWPLRKIPRLGIIIDEYYLWVCSFSFSKRRKPMKQALKLSPAIYRLECTKNKCKKRVSEFAILHKLRR